MLYGTNGKFLSRKIFFEKSTPDSRETYPPLYTLKLREHNGLPSAYEIYMSCVDEYEAAIKLVGNMKNWRELEGAAWFMDGCAITGHEGLKSWRADMQARDASLAKELLIEQTKEGNTTAARALLAESKVKKGQGRKTKKTKLEDGAVALIKNYRNKQ